MRSTYPTAQLLCVLLREAFVLYSHARFGHAHRQRIEELHSSCRLTGGRLLLGSESMWGLRATVDAVSSLFELRLLMCVFVYISEQCRRWPCLHLGVYC